MRQAARVDANQPAIVDALRRIGAEVTPLHAVGHGCPDLLVSYRGRWHMLEVKDGSKPQSRRELTKDQVRWIEEAKAPVCIVTTADEALKAVLAWT